MRWTTVATASPAARAPTSSASTISSRTWARSSAGHSASIPAHRSSSSACSMGGAIALGCALKYENALRALVLSAPALAVLEEPSLARLLFVKALSALSPDTGVLTLPARAISRDPQVVHAYENDPLVFHGAIPARTAAELFLAMERLQRKAHELRLPVLIQHGSADELVPLAATHPVYQHLGLAKRRTLQIYDGLYHEIYNEPERDRVIADLVSWLAV